MVVQTSLTMSPEMDALRKKYNISVAEAFRVGMSVILSELGEDQFQNNLNKLRIVKEYEKKMENYKTKMNRFREMYEEASEELNKKGVKK